MRIASFPAGNSEKKTNLTSRRHSDGELNRALPKQIIKDFPGGRKEKEKRHEKSNKKRKTEDKQFLSPNAFLFTRRHESLRGQYSEGYRMNSKQIAQSVAGAIQG